MSDDYSDMECIISNLSTLNDTMDKIKDILERIAVAIEKDKK